MRPRLRLILVGVGALLAFSSASKGIAEPVSDSSWQPSHTSQPSVDPEQTAASKQPIVVEVIAEPERETKLEKVAVQPPQSLRVDANHIGIDSIPVKVRGIETAQNQLQSQPASAPATKPTSKSTSETSAPLPQVPYQITTPDPGPSKPIGPAKPGTAPEYLNPDSNPLQFPTNPEEVKLRGIQPITLKQALELAERNNRNLQVTRLQVDRSRAAVREAQAEGYPTLTLQTNLTNSRSASGDLNQQANQRLGLNTGNNGSNTSLDSTLALSYDLFTSGGRPARIRAAERQLRSDQLQLESVLEQLRLDVSSDYYDLQEADESVRINQASVRNNEISLRDAQALERAGLGTRFDVLRSEVQLANSRQQLTSAIAQQQIRRRQLAQRLSIAQFVDLAAADPVEKAGDWGLPLEDSIILAFKNRAELEQQLVQRELSNQQRRAALSALGPTVTLSAQYELLNVFDDGLGFGDGYSLRAGLRWNLFEGGAARARAAQQEYNMQIAETRFADVRNQVRFQVEQSYATLVSSLQNIDTTTRAVEQAREALRLARLRFQAGVGTQSDVINAETDLTRAEGNKITAILGYNRALASLKRSITNISPGTNATP